jgi:hypothetical protein
MAIPRPLTVDEHTADRRIVEDGIPFMDEHYPLWRNDLGHGLFYMADPYTCLVCKAELAVRLFGKFGERNYHSIQWLTTPRIHFHEIMRQHRMTMDDAIRCALAKAPTDPSTFYAALRDRWIAHAGWSGRMAA